MPKEVSSPSVTLSGNECVYTGEEIRPAVVSVEDGGIQIADTEYTVSYRENINAGTAYALIADQAGGNYTVNGSTAFTITKADYPTKTAEGKAGYGTNGMLELKECLAPLSAGGSYRITGWSDPAQALSGNAVLSGTMLTWTFLDDRSLVDKTATVVISVTNARNYKDYELTVTLKVNDCVHSHTELRDVKAGTCVEEGYSGDRYCLDCGAMIERGRATPKDPDNHHFDLNDESHKKVTKEATLLQPGIHTYTCVWCHTATMEREDIPCLPDEKGRDLEELREDVADLSGNAIPKIDEKKDDKGNTVEETVTIGGEEVSKIITDPESGKETVESKVWIGGLKESYTYTGAVIKPSFHVYDGIKILTEKTDYTVTYSKNKNVGTAKIKLEFKGNYSNTKKEELSFEIKPAVLGVDVIAHETGTEVKKNEQKPVPVLTWAQTGNTVGIGNFNVSYDRSPVKEAGTYTATVTPKKADGNFAGSTTALIKVTEKSKLLSKTTVVFDRRSYAYTGKTIVPKYTLKIGTVKLEENIDYKRVSILGNTDPGTATVIFEAVSGNSKGYVGTKTASFKITGKIALKEEAPFEYAYEGSVPYAKGGAKPAVKVTYDGVTLKEGADYTVSYKKNNAVTGSATAEIEIKGKGRYKDTVTKKYAVTKQTLKASGITATAADQFTTRSKLKAPKITIYDVNGKKLKAGTDYTAGTDYAYTGDDASGTVTVTVTGKGNYKEDASESIKVTYRYLQAVSSDIAKAKVMKSISSREYTESEIRLSNADLTGILYTGKKDSPDYLVPGRDFKVTGYSDNVEKGTAKVTLQGLGDYAGTKTLTFKIVRKKVDYKGKLGGGK